MRQDYNNIIERVSALAIGTVESVRPGSIKVVLDPDAPESNALNTGKPTAFPRINSFLLMPNEVGAVVGIVTSMAITRSDFPKRKGLKDFNLVDLPFPLREMTVTPIGTLTEHEEGLRSDSELRLALRRGVTVFPSVGDVAYLPTERQRKCIMEAARPADRRVKIGTSPLAGKADVTIDPDKLFGRHLAVLGNTGSGKSCSVAGIIRWCLERAKAEKDDDSSPVNARFIILDPNGEYAKAFNDLKERVRVFQVEDAPGPSGGTEPLNIPAWMWNSNEWCAFSRASEGAQRPLLMRALRYLRSGVEYEGADIEKDMFRFLGVRRQMLRNRLDAGPEQLTVSTGGAFRCRDEFRSIERECTRFRSDVDNAYYERLTKAIEHAQSVLDARVDGDYVNDFDYVDLNRMIDLIDSLISDAPETASSEFNSADAPIKFDVEELPSYLRELARDEGGNAARFVGWLTSRIKVMLEDRRLGPILGDRGHSLAEWLRSYVGASGSANGEIAILDLSLIPSDVIHVVIAVISRIIFEAIQRYAKWHPDGKQLPTVLTLEEAHTFVQKGTWSRDNLPLRSEVCRETFERIAREGRKFGLGLVIASQRPSELSPTVLAQCNTFLVHRLVNERDREIVSSSVPDSLGELLAELPSLPTGRAILTGLATEVPALVDISELPEDQQPESANPDYWDVWTGKADREVDWEELAQQWKGRQESTSRTAEAEHEE